MTYEMCLNLEAAVFKVASQRRSRPVTDPIAASFKTDPAAVNW